MEQLYAFFLRVRKPLHGFTFPCALGVFSGIISDTHLNTFWDLLISIRPDQNLSVALMYLMLILSLAVEIGYRITAYIYHKKSESAVLAKEMKEHTDPSFEQIGFRGGYSWAADRTWIVCEDIFAGWKPDSLFVEVLENTPYSFQDKYPDLLKPYQEYMQGKEAQGILQRKNNNERVMLTNVIQNYNSQDKRIYFYLRKTDWCTNRFLWTYMHDNPHFKAQKIGDIYTGKQTLLPNSLCLHLILVTADYQVVLARISNNKRNDYPSTWAATIGEQMEPTDVVDRGNYSSDFVYKWVQRAMGEEFGIEGSMYETVLDVSSIRVLALDVEGDIYNFALATVAKLRCNFSEFVEQLQKTPDSEKELADLKAISFDEIPAILAGYPENKNEYHPSTYLRLYLCYIHRYGVDRFVRQYQHKIDRKGCRPMMPEA